MKFVLVFVLGCFLLSCSVHQTEQLEVVRTSPPTPPVATSEALASSSDGTLTDDVPPSNFRDVDFNNFAFPFGTLKDGSLDTRKPLAGGTSYSVDEVLYVNLVDTPAKEALVTINKVNCGGSCDGGASSVYVYGTTSDVPRLLATLDLGSRAGGCSLKSLIVENQALSVTQFGRCRANTQLDRSIQTCKFCSKGETVSTWSFVGRKLKRTNVSETDTPEQNVMNYKSEIELRSSGFLRNAL